MAGNAPTDWGMEGSMRLTVAIATLGRPEVIADVIPRWLAQTRAPDRVILSATQASDVGTLPAGVETIFGSKGLCAQRNRVLDLLKGQDDLVVFVDDDYVPSKGFLAEVEDVFADPSIVAGSGNVLADGVYGEGFTYDYAASVVDAYDAAPRTAPARLIEARHTYGCNMIIRQSVAPDLRFDERLPLYGWQEDLDFSRRLKPFGRVIWSERIVGVHMGVKGGRQSGVKLGYSQVANPLYLASKRSMPPQDALAMVGKNIAANLVRSFAPEPWVDRPGRLYGNALALVDLLRGRQRPERILEL